MKVTIEVPTYELRRLLDVTSHDTNLHHVPVENLIQEAIKRGITAWETSSPITGSAAALVDTCFMLVKAWEERGLRSPPPDFGHILNAVRTLKAAGYRR